MWLGVLGPLQVGSQGAPVSAAKQRVVLAALVLHAGRVVSFDELAAALWGDSPPDHASTTVRTYVHRLRRVLGPAGASRIVTQDPGYLLRAGDDELDVRRFEQLLRDGGAAVRAGDWPAAQQRLTDALALWRGPALVDIDSERLHRDHVPRLDQMRLQALEWRMQAELNLGRHDGLVPELRALVETDPLGERLAGLLMLALYRCGRRAEALDAYQEVRKRLVDELGVEPGPQLRHLHERILREDRALDRSRAVPHQIPPDLPTFVGRGEEVAALVGHLDESVAAGRVAVCLIDGPAGIGKTSLAIRVAHEVSARYPDGCLWTTRRAHGASADESLRTLARFLLALGVPAGEIPGDLEPALSTYRSVLAQRRVLLVIDGVEDPAALAPLLPARGASAALVTSRAIMSTVDHTYRVRLGLLSAEASVGLLTRHLGPARVGAEPDATRRLAHWCAGLPLALRIAGARLAARPTWSVAGFADRLRHEHDRLDELAVGELAVRRSFQLSYRALTRPGNPAGQQAARTFRLLGLVHAGDIAAPAAAALVDLPGPAARAALEHLVDVGLADTSEYGRYRLHDLLHVFAREQAQEAEPATERETALSRLATFHITAAHRALYLLRLLTTDVDATVDGVPHDEEQARDWFATEWHNLRDLAEQLARSHPEHGRLALRLIPLISHYGGRWQYDADVRALNTLALATAEALGDLPGVAKARNALGVAAMRAGDLDLARTHLRQCLATWEQVGAAAERLAPLNNLGHVHRRRGEMPEAIECFRACLRIARETGDIGRQSTSLDNLGLVYQNMGRIEEALRHHEESLSLLRAAGDQHREALVLINYGQTMRLAGRAATARALLEDSIRICVEFGNEAAVIPARLHLGEALADLGELDAARACWLAALAAAESSGSVHAEEIRAALAALPGL